MSKRLSYALLCFGAALGVTIAVVQVMTRGPDVLPKSYAAVVNGVPISQDAFERAVEAVQNDAKPGSISAADKAKLLDRLIDEELLLQHARTLGLERNDPTIRGHLVRRVIDTVVTRDAQPPTDRQLARFYEERKAEFKRPVRVRVEHTFRSKSGDTKHPLGLPSTPVPMSMVVQRLGPTVGKAVSALEVGARSKPIKGADGVHIVKLLERTGGDVPPLNEVREVVLKAYEYEQQDEALRDIVAKLRAQAQIRKAM